MICRSFLPIVISSFLFFTSIDAQVANEGPVPPEFKCQDCILVIIKPESEKALPKFEKNVAKQFDKYYSGKCEIVTAKELEADTRFQDKKTYRFSLNYKTRGQNVVSTGADGRMRNFTKTYISFYLHDRESNKTYPSMGEARSGLQTLENTAKALEAIYK